MQGEGALGGSRNEVSWVHPDGQQVAQVEVKPVESGCGEHDGIVASLLQALDPRGHIAAQGLDVEVRPEQEQLVPAADRGGADDGSGMEREPGGGTVGSGMDQDVLGCSSLGDGGDAEAVWLSGFEVLVAVDSKVDAVFGGPVRFPS